MKYNVKLSKGKININGKEYDIPDDCRHCVNDHNCKTYYGSNECMKKWKETC